MWSLHPLAEQLSNGGNGAGRAVAVVTVEWLLSVQLRDLRGDARQWPRRADSGRSGGRNRTAGFTPN